jgi:hypothetical protein
MTQRQKDAGAKAHLIRLKVLARLKRLRKRGRDFCEIGGKHTSGPKGRVNSAAFTPGINPRPTSRQSFSASFEVVPFYKTSSAYGLAQPRFFIKLSCSMMFDPGMFDAGLDSEALILR